MQAVGIIAEYNPFHNGHLHHLRQSMELTGADVSVAVISGNFTQRGSFAILDKWTRAEMAVRNGVNLVVEMPTLFACGNAGYFARAGVEILENLGAAYISFGSESGNIQELKRIAGEMRDHRNEINEAVRAAVKNGQAYPKARAEALQRILGEDIGDIIESPNNLLALEYLRFIKNAEPVTVRRQGTGYYDPEPKGTMASATGIRKILAEGGDISRLVPDITREMLFAHRGEILSEEDLYLLLIQKILTSSAEELNRIFGAEEGLGNKMKANVRYWKSYEEIAEGLKSKRYTRTRIGRVLAMTLLGVRREDMKQARNYIRVLAFDETGSRYLKEVKKSEGCRLPILTNINREEKFSREIQNMLAKDILAGDLYNFACGRDLYACSDYVKKPFHPETGRSWEEERL